MDEPGPDFDAASFLKSLPGQPGVYRMIGSRGEILYVGKARSLRKRVPSYYRPRAQLDSKTAALMSHAERVDFTVTHTETEALLLENNLIKEHRPRYNIVLRDDKSFPYIYVSTRDDFPRLAFHRGPKSGTGRYFGPFASAGATRQTLTLIQKLFRVRQCEDPFFRNRSRPCLQHQIDRCTAPCVGLATRERYAEDIRHAIMFLEGRSEAMIQELVGQMEAAAKSLDYEAAARYRDQIASLRRVQERQYVSGGNGDVDVVAACVRDGVAVVQVTVIRNGQSLGDKTLTPAHASGATPAELLAAFLPQYYLTRSSSVRDIPSEILVDQPVEDVSLIETALGEHRGQRVRVRHRVRGSRARWMAMARANAELQVGQRLADRASLEQRFEALQEALGLEELPSRIECFDVSHTGGEETVASCVVFERQGAVKSDYRRFNIRTSGQGDDYAAMREALERRYTRVRREEGRLPDVLLVDGGRGQLAEATAVLSDLQIEGVTLVGVAKGASRKPGLESLHVEGRPTALQLAADSPALHLIQQIRDESHRFAITGHRTRRSRARQGSVLERIPGIGAKRRQRLLREFGGLQGVARAGMEDLERVGGISRGLAHAIYTAFRDGA